MKCFTLTFLLFATAATAAAADDHTFAGTWKENHDIADEGPLATKGNTSACKMVEAGTLEWTYKLNGKVTGLGRMTLSADGRSIERVSWAPGKESEKTISVLDRQ